ncbi:MAG: hypothetical protein JEZ03_15370 [Bacteroidales bacterium]|nr:hypothetical protein [Bacteroidales bacterium]
MKPLKSLMPLAVWLMRLGVGLYAYSRYLNTLLDLNFKAISFYVAALNILFAALLIAGGFSRKHNLTVLSALMLLLVTIYQAVTGFQNTVNFSLAVYTMVGAVSFYFISAGNR